MITFFLIFLLINILLFQNQDKISKLYNIYDVPDQIRKKHKFKIPLTGGLFFFINFFFLIIFLYFHLIENDFFKSNVEILIFLISSAAFFLLGILDDKFFLNANLKLVLKSFIIIFTIFFDKSLILKEVTFSFSSTKLLLFSFSYFLTILCFLLFINAFNMLDGINGQAASYSIFIILIFILNKININFFSILILSMIFFLYFNFRNKMFLGNSGSLLLGYLISYFFVKSYNIQNFLFSDEVFLIMMIPGFELLRLAIFRLVKKKHPFKADRNHIHHLILNKKKFLTTFLTIQFILMLPYLSHVILSNTIISFVLSTVIYFLIIIIFYKKYE